MNTQDATKLFPPRPEWLGNEQGCPPFDILNLMLYEAVAANPSNTEPAEIIGKLILIGRTYSASVERRKTSGEAEERQALEVVIAAAEAIAKSRCGQLLNELDVELRLTTELLPKAVTIHRELCDALQLANNRENSSLASKYLHFHRPNFFPIVDSYVREGWSYIMEELECSYRGWRVFGKVSRYQDWCLRILALRDMVEKETRAPVTLRRLDNYLLSIMSLDGQGGWGLPRLTG